jgi:uroporphyrinogen-III synthase
MSKIASGAGVNTPILLLKTKSTPSDGYEEQFSRDDGDVQFEPTFVPVLEHKLLDDGLSVMRELLQQKQISKNEGAKYGGMIFTSQRAVEAFARLVREGQGTQFLHP